MFIFNDLDSRTSSKFGLPSINVTMPFGDMLGRIWALPVPGG